jgi:citrate lyase beta subunit
VRYFNYLCADDEKARFFLPPQHIPVHDRSILQYALGATLYMPATRKTVTQDIVSGKLNGLMSMVLCLEDAIGDNEVTGAENLLGYHFKQLAIAVQQGLIELANMPLLFVRIRDVSQMQRIMELLVDNARFLTGFVFPKFTTNNGRSYLETLAELNVGRVTPLYGMPIIESPEAIYVESRPTVLREIKNLLDRYHDLVLNIRIGATDFSGIYGLRRSPELTIYDILPIGQCIADIVNVFCRPDSSYVVSGPVWEFYSSERVFKPQLRQSPFTARFGKAGDRLRDSLLCHYMDGLIHEILLDKANGLIGKTIIHPSHIKPVQALCVVTHEEYMDACSILANDGGDVGVMPSLYANKMNEIKPHRQWAQNIMLKSKIYGVFNEQQNFTSMLGAEVLL